jgi:ammonia channel protein AmtB
MFGKSKVIEELQQLHGFAYDCECCLELVNGETHESMKPDPAAIKAGFIAGIVAATSIVRGTNPHEALPEQVGAAMCVAGKVYLEETLARGEESDVVQHG